LRGPVQSVEVSYLVHATEDSERLGEAIQLALGITSSPEEQELEGHFGNTIIRARHHLTGDSAASVLTSLVASLTAPARKEALLKLEESIDKHGILYLRLDKQSFLAGALVLSDGDAVRVRVKPRLFTLKGSAREFFRSALGGDS
jgi:RNA binding exosome subunit